MNLRKGDLNIACLELSQALAIGVTIPALWEHGGTKWLLHFDSHFYAVQKGTIKVNGGHQRKHVFAVTKLSPEFQGGKYVKKVNDYCFRCGSRDKNWQVKALVAAGYSEEQIIAVNVAARLMGEL